MHERVLRASCTVLWAELLYLRLRRQSPELSALRLWIQWTSLPYLLKALVGPGPGQSRACAADSPVNGLRRSVHPVAARVVTVPMQIDLY